MNKAAKLTVFAVSPPGSLWVMGHQGENEKEKIQSQPQEGPEQRAGHVNRKVRDNPVTIKACGKGEK